jgi:glycine/D-amino acid oxidase-like deaminating enzyme
MATLIPFHDPVLFFARETPSRSYALAAEVGDIDVNGMYLLLEGPRSVRSHPVDGGRVLIIEGEEHVVGRENDTAARYSGLESWARETMHAGEVTHRWSAQDYMTPDSVPRVGYLPGSDRVLLATGFNKWGMAAGTAAGLMLSDLILGRSNDWTDLFSPSRVSFAEVPTVLHQAAETTRSVVASRFHTGQRRGGCCPRGRGRHEARRRSLCGLPR